MLIIVSIDRTPSKLRSRNMKRKEKLFTSYLTFPSMGNYTNLMVSNQVLSHLVPAQMTTG